MDLQLKFWLARNPLEYAKFIMDDVIPAFSMLVSNAILDQLVLQNYTICQSILFILFPLYLLIPSGHHPFSAERNQATQRAAHHATAAIRK